MHQQVVILGSGGFALELQDWIKDDNTIQLKGFYSDTDTKESMLDLPVYKNLEIIKSFGYYIAVGDPILKSLLNNRAKSHGMKPARPFIHPSVIIGSKNHIEDGVIICPKTIITHGVHIKQHALINLNCTIGHECKIGLFTTISPGANISGNVQLGDFNYIGTNATIREKIRTTQNVTIGMSSVVIKDLNHAGVYVGNPLRKL